MNDSDISSISEPGQELSVQPKRRRRRRWLHFVILFVLIPMVVAYAMLPWLIPTDWLRSQIEAGIETQLGRSASLSSIEISWSEGIIIRDVEINRLEQFGQGFFLKTSRIQLDFRPLRLLLLGRLGKVRVDDPQLWIVAEAGGKLNLASLPSVERRDDAFELITISNATLHFIDQVHASESHLAIAKIEVAREASSGRYSLAAQGAASESSGEALFSLRAEFTPTDNAHDILARGSAKLSWSDFDLAGIPLPRTDKLDLQMVGGKTSGKAELELYSDGRVELSACTAELDKLDLQIAKISDLSEPSQVRIPRADFELQGSYELVSGELSVGTLRGKLDGLDCSSSLQGRVFPAERTFAPSAAWATLTVQPSRLREQFPFLDELFREHDLTVTGSSKLTLAFKQSEAIDHLSFSMDTSNTGIHLPSLVHKSDGLACRMKVSAVIDHNSGILAMAEPLEIELASSRFSLDMHLAQPLRMASFLDLLVRPREIAQLAQSQLSQARINSSLDIGQISDLVGVFPTLAEVLSDNKITLAGPARAEFKLEPILRDALVGSSNQVGQSSLAIGPTVLTAEVSFPATSSLEWPSYFIKGLADPLSFSLSTRLSQGSLRLDALQISCKIGQATISVTDAFCGLEFSPRGWSDFVPTLSSRGRFCLENTAALTQALPALQGLGLEGDLVGGFDLGFDGRSSLRLKLALNASDLAFGVPIALDGNSEAAVLFGKSALTPAKLELQFRLGTLSENNSQAGLMSWPELTVENALAGTFGAKLNWTLGDSLGSLEIENQRDPSKKGLGFEVTLSKIDLDSLAENFPLLGSICERYQLAGSAAVKLGGQLSPELSLKNLDFDGDFTAVQFVLPMSAEPSGGAAANIIVRKSAQIPLTLQASLRAEDHDKQDRRFKIESSRLNFAGSQLNFSGSVIMAEALENPGYRFLQTGPFVRAQLAANGTVVFDQDFLGVFPALEPIQGRMDLSGVLDYQLALSVEPGQAAMQAKLSSGSELLRVGPAEFSKAEHHLKLSFDEGLAVSGVWLKLDALELSLFDEPVNLSTELTLDQDQLDIEDLFIALGNSSGHLTAHLESIATAPTGSVSFYSPLVDQSRLEDFGEKLSSFAQRQSTLGQSSADDETSSLANESPGPEQPSVGPKLPALPPMDINIRAELDKLIVSMGASSGTFTVQEVSLDSKLTSTSLTGRFTMAFNGGRLAGEHSVMLDEPGLPLFYRYEALDLIADENTAPLVSQVFPNLSVQGTITESRSVRAYLLGGDKFSAFGQEEGLNILGDGIVIGPSAPGWVTYWFPDLSLTKYPFEVSHNVFSKDPKSGQVSNDMVFLGKGSYNIYINGITRADNTTAYTLGVDLSLMSLEKRHIWKSSRVPLLSFTGQIVDHKWARQTVSYTWPTRAAWDIFVKNNAIKTLVEQWRQPE